MSKPEVQERAPQYDVALSFAGEQRAYAEQLAKVLRASGVRVFYDRDLKAVLWGKNLIDYLHDIYCNEARFCVVFVSEAYARKRWTTHERKAAQERVFREVTSEYLLPIKVDETTLPGLPETVGYASIGDGIEEIARMLLEKLRGRTGLAVQKTISDKTKKSYARDFAHFEAWCAEKGWPSLPTTPEVVMAYLPALADGKVRVNWRARNGSLRTRTMPKKYSTIESAYMAIIHTQRSAGHEWPHAHPGIVGVKKAIRVKFGTAKRKVTPLEIGTLKKCLASYGPSTEVGAARNRALLSLGFFAALHRSELVALRVEDVRFTRRGLLVTKTRSGKPVAVPTLGNEAICPVRLLRAWLDQSGITEGPLFRRIDDRTGAIGGVALTAPVVALVIKSAVERAGLDPELFAGHSLRAGFATSAAAAGKSLHDIMRQTRHKSERIAMTYTRRPGRRHAREGYLFESNPADGID